MATPCSGKSRARPAAVLMALIKALISRVRSRLKARSSSVEHCQHMAEVGGSIPSRAYQSLNVRPVPKPPRIDIDRGADQSIYLCQGGALVVRSIAAGA